MKRITQESLYSVIGILFVFSGGLGLIYQIIWFKYLSLFLGYTTYAQTIVLATFMGGLAIGSALFGRKADISKSPFRIYALLELGIGLYCLIYPKFLDLLKYLFISIVTNLQLDSGSNNVLMMKLLISILSLLLPTILMGGTLPVLARFISRRLSEAGRNVAILYFLNSFGAVVGSLLAGFFFIRLIGLNATIYSTSILSILIGVIAFVLSRVKIVYSSNKEELRYQDKSNISYSQRDAILAIITAGLSGIAAMIYEVTWVRLLLPVFGSSTYSFSIMLIAFISGIAIGSYIVTFFIRRIKNLLMFLALCQFLIVLAMFLTLPFYGRLPYEFWRVASLLTHSAESYPIYFAIQLILSFSLMIIPTIFLGMSLPVATRIASRSVKILGKSVGNVYAINTLGTVIGSLLAGLVLIPLVGIRHTMEIGIVFNMASGLLIIFLSASIRKKLAYLISSSIFIATLLYLLISPSWSKEAMLYGVFRRLHQGLKLPEKYSDFLNMVKSGRNILFYEEGVSANVGVLEVNEQRTLIVNGNPDASSGGDLLTQALCGHLPCILHSDPQNVLVIGLGSGITLGSVLMHPIKHVDCVEISPEVVKASRYFDDVNNKPLDDKRTILHIEDALAYLKLTKNKYDIIISAPTNPWIAGVGNLFTVEFFEKCKLRLNPGGYVLQWFQLYEMDNELFKMVVRTFKNSFKNISFWQVNNADIILIGSNDSVQVDYDKIENMIKRDAIAKDLKRLKIPDVATLLSLQMLSPNSVDKFIDIGFLNTEDHPRLEYNAPKSFFMNVRVNEVFKYDERLKSKDVNIFLVKYLEKRKISDQELRNIGFYHTEPNVGNYDFGYAILKNINLQNQKDSILLKRLITVAENLNLPEKALSYSKMLVDLFPKDAAALEKYAWLKYMLERKNNTIIKPLDIKEYELIFQKCIALASDTVDRFHLRLADIYFDVQEYAKAKDHYIKVLDLGQKYTYDPNIRDDMIFLQIGRCFVNMNQADRAINYLLQAININPKNETAKDLIFSIMMSKSKQQK